MKGDKEIVLKASKGITFDVKEGTSGELIVRAINTQLDAYANPPIPEGYKHILGE